MTGTEHWVWPDGPWGWNEDGTSKAPTPQLRASHVNWYHDLAETKELERIQDGGCMYCDGEATMIDRFDHPCCSECNAPADE